MDYATRIKKHSFVRITLQDTTHKYGFFVDDMNWYVAIIVDFDFFVDGYMLINKKTIKSIRVSEQEKFYEKLYRINHIKLPSKKIEKDFEAVLHAHMKKQEFVIIETFKKKEYSFDIWVITNIYSEYCLLKPISSVWVCEKEKKIMLWNIDILSRWSRYAKIFQKYMLKK